MTRRSRSLSFLMTGVANLLIIGGGHAQTTAGREPPFMPLRFMDDVEGYCEGPEVDRSANFKCIRLDGPDGPILSFGGELKWKLEAFQSPQFGFAAADVVYPLQRALLHADVRPTTNVRAFVQFGHHVRYGSNTLARPTDESDVDLQQGFVDLFWRRGPDDGWAVRVGRQELGWVRRASSVAEKVPICGKASMPRLFPGSPPVASGSKHSRAARWRTGLVPSTIARTTRARSGTCTPRPVYGGRSSFPERPNDEALSLNLYYFGFENERARFRDGFGSERRDAYGARVFGYCRKLDLDWETQLQTGRFAQATIRAFTIATDTGWSFPNRLEPAPWAEGRYCQRRPPGR